MAVVVEDGTGLTNADSYVSDADCQTYLDTHASTEALNAYTAEATATVRDVALRNAARFIDGEFGLRFKGRRIKETQALQWPRNSVTSNDGYAVPSTAVPQIIKNAACELALRFLEDSTGHATSRLSPDQDTPGTIIREKLKGDVAETDTTYSGADQQKLYTLVEHMLGPLLEPAGEIVFG